MTPSTKAVVCVVSVLLGAGGVYLYWATATEQGRRYDEGLKREQEAAQAARDAPPPITVHTEPTGIYGLSVLTDVETGCQWFFSEQRGQGGRGPSSLVPRMERLPDGRDRQVCEQTVIGADRPA